MRINFAPSKIFISRIFQIEICGIRLKPIVDIPAIYCQLILRLMTLDNFAVSLMLNKVSRECFAWKVEQVGKVVEGIRDAYNTRILERKTMVMRVFVRQRYGVRKCKRV